MKTLYPVTIDFTRKWTERISDWGQILAQLSIILEERLNGRARSLDPK